MFTVNHHDMAFGLERLVEERRQAAYRALGREACAADPAPSSRLERALAGAGNWLAVWRRRLGEAEKPIATTDTQHARTR